MPLGSQFCPTWRQLGPNLASIYFQLGFNLALTWLQHSLVPDSCIAHSPGRCCVYFGMASDPWYPMNRFRRIKQYIAAQLSLHPTHRFSIHSVGRRHQGHAPFKYPDPSWLAFFATLVLPWPQPGLNLALPRIQNVFTLASSWNHAPGAITPSAMTFHLHHFFNHGRLYVQYFVHRSLHPRP